jgi:tetratricopeptide (TPR) repeat protein
MNALQPPYSLHLQAAQGWLELGNHVEAEAELDNITASLRAHPVVLRVRWEVYAAVKKWEAALDIAAAVIQLDPDGPLGWVYRSYALHELKRTAEARDNLLRVVDRFPASATIRYNLACYECQLGRLEQAKGWLQKAFRLGNAKQMKLAALGDPDLQPLWRGDRQHMKAKRCRSSVNCKEAKPVHGLVQKQARPGVSRACGHCGTPFEATPKSERFCCKQHRLGQKIP